jgi:uncharacterized membrane protein
MVTALTRMKNRLKEMTEGIYQSLHAIGYTHPLHPTMTHLPMGVVMATLIFGILARVLKKENVARTARHCAILAMIGLLPTVILGYMDWQYRFAGGGLLPIQAKLVLALLLVALLIGAVAVGREKIPLALYGLCFVTVVGLAYFGGELIYGKWGPQDQEAEDPLLRRGAELFSKDCAACHYTDSKKTKIGPGLKAVLAGESLPVSGRPATEENVRRQIKNPYENMPSFPHLEEEQMNALVAYLRSL